MTPRPLALPAARVQPTRARRSGNRVILHGDAEETPRAKAAFSKALERVSLWERNGVTSWGPARSHSTARDMLRYGAAEAGVAAVEGPLVRAIELAPSEHQRWSDERMGLGWCIVGASHPLRRR